VYGNPLGYLDDAGAFHSPDGAVVFSPGSACGNYSPSSFPTALGASCSTDDDCQTWIASHFPPSYPVFNFGCHSNRCDISAIPLGAGNPTPAQDHGPGKEVYCTPGPEGDNYCTAFFEQFILGDAHVLAWCQDECVVESAGQPPSADQCVAGTEFHACVTTGPDNASCYAQGSFADLQLCVERTDAGFANTEIPCAPPPEASEAGPADAGTEQ
jgi:hypothetical protein